MINYKNFTLRTVLVCAVFTLFINCGDTNKTPNNKDGQKDESNQKTISVKAIANFKYNDYILSSDAENEVRPWVKFQELATQISYLKTADITFFTEEKDTLKKFIDSLKISIPDNINTSPVNARITALETKLLKLNTDLNLGNYPTEQKLQSIKELLIANSNLIFVINKKLEFDQNDIERPEDEITEETIIEDIDSEQ